MKIKFILFYLSFVEQFYFTTEGTRKHGVTYGRLKFRLPIFNKKAISIAYTIGLEITLKIMIKLSNK